MALVIIAAGVLYALSARRKASGSEGVERGFATVWTNAGAQEAERSQHAHKASAEVITGSASREASAISTTVRRLRSVTSEASPTDIARSAAVSYRWHVQNHRISHRGNELRVVPPGNVRRAAGGAGRLTGNAFDTAQTVAETRKDLNTPWAKLYVETRDVGKVLLPLKPLRIHPWTGYQDPTARLLQTPERFYFQHLHHFITGHP